jgi:hypothetical protein
MQAMQDRDDLVAADMVVAMALDLVVDWPRMCQADFPLPTVVVSHQHHLPMVAVFLPEVATMGDISKALPSLPGISNPVSSMVVSHKTSTNP